MSDATKQADGRLLLVHSDDYSGWVFDASHPTQGRRFLNARQRVLALAPEADGTVIEIESDRLPDFSTLAQVHDRDYVESVVLDGLSAEWHGERRDLGRLALQMAGGTLLALDALLAGDAMTAVHFAGAKHHAMRDRSSGFCVFNDFALAAVMAASRTRPMENGEWEYRIPLRVAIFDIDAHHGDGTEALTRDHERILTYSVHDRSIFPGSGRADDPDNHVFNRALASGSGDAELALCATGFVQVAQPFYPDLVMIAGGADGLAEDPLSTLNYTIEGLVNAVRFVRRGFPDVPILLGGAGGYRPDDLTPEAWARMAVAIAQPVDEADRVCCDLDDVTLDHRPS